MHIFARNLFAALGLVICGALTLVAGAGAASAAPAGSARPAVGHATAPGHTIATAGTLGVADSASGGGGPIDFWDVTLNGGDQLQFTVSLPNGGVYAFQLYAPGTTDNSFSTARAFTGAADGAGQQTFSLYAPYNATFILAVCENVANYNCANEPNQGGTNPMGAYTFTTLLASGPTPAVAKTETQAGASIAGAPTINADSAGFSSGAGQYEAGGGNGGIDYWKVTMHGGDQLQFTVSLPEGGVYAFQLYAPGTTDNSFSTARAFTGAADGAAQQTFSLDAPYNGTFILAVCENVANYNCANEPNQGGINPINPYLFHALLTAGPTPAVAKTETQAGASIAGAPTINADSAGFSSGAGQYEAGGGNGGIDYWKVTMHGGDRLQFTVSLPEGGVYAFQLYAPGTTDNSFSTAGAFSGAADGAAQQTFSLDAPYNGTFILAVCENVANYNCANEPNQGGINPINPYTFHALLTAGPGPVVAKTETQASPTIAGARTLNADSAAFTGGAGQYEAGGGTAVDFWRLHLNGGDKLQFTVNLPEGGVYAFQLYAPSTTDNSFPRASALWGTADGAAQQTFSLTAPYSGNFILAVCENAQNYNCATDPSQGGSNPMNPYNFHALLFGGPATTTSLKLSAGSVAYSTEKSLRLTATVRGLFDGTPSGKVVITTGKTTVCTIARLSGGKGTCSPASNTLLKPGTYPLTATYHGNLATSTATARLTVVPNRPTRTTLKLSAATIAYGHEKSLKLTATTTPINGGTLTGKIIITAGSKTICTITTLTKGTGTCSPASNTLLKAGTYKLVATYTGNDTGSKSGLVTLIIKP